MLTHVRDNLFNSADVKNVDQTILAFLLPLTVNVRYSSFFRFRSREIRSRWSPLNELLRLPCCGLFIKVVGCVFDLIIDQLTANVIVITPRHYMYVLRVSIFVARIDLQTHVHFLFSTSD